MRLALRDRLGQRLKVRFPGFVLLAQPLQAALHEGRTLAELQLLLRSRHGRPFLGYFIPNSAATCATRFDASLRVIRRVSCRKRMALSLWPVRTSPYNCISHLESTPAAAGFSHSTRTLPSGMPCGPGHGVRQASVDRAFRMMAWARPAGEHEKPEPRGSYLRCS